MSRIRIVGGQWRSRLIEVPEATSLRPTPDRVRETLFNWLGQDLTGWRCLDLFAGSGALGFEAASRGAAEVVMVEAAPRVLAHLKAAKASLRAEAVSIVPGDALAYRSQANFDLIFLDPPFRQGWLEKLAPRIDALLAKDGMVYVESEAAVEAWAGLALIKSGKAGQVHYQLFTRPEPESTP